MHELGIVFHVIKTVERVGAENDLTRVAGVTLELGEVCGDTWLLRGSEISIKEIEGA